jgi:excisionase family DNA binding protein
MEDRKVSTLEASELLGVSRDAVYRAARDGKIPSERIAGRYIIMLSDARKWYETGYEAAKGKRYPEGREEKQK